MEKAPIRITTQHWLLNNDEITRNEYITLCKRPFFDVKYAALFSGTYAEFEVTEYLFDDENIETNLRQ